MLASVTQGIGGPLGRLVGWGGLWPLLVLVAGAGFWLPLVIWWDQRDKIAGLVVPATIVSANGLLLLYQNLTGNWGSWAYAWAIEPMAVGLSLALLYLLTDERPRGLLIAAAIVGGVGALFFVIFASAFGGAVGIVAPVLLIILGMLVLLRGMGSAQSGDGPPA
jgi:hypothetical protein